MRTQAELVDALVESLEPLPSMVIRQAEAEAFNAANPGVLTGIALEPEGTVRVKDGFGEQFWGALQELYDAEGTGRVIAVISYFALGVVFAALGYGVAWLQDKWDERRSTK